MTEVLNECRYASVMLIDDSELDNYINEKIIRLCRFATEIRVTDTVREALAYLNGISDACDAPEVIFVDLNMPVMSGYQFISHIRHLRQSTLKSTKLVILTSSLHEHDREQAAQLGDDIVYLNKPLRPEVLFSI